MATLAQLESALVKADAAGNADDARVLAAEIRKMRKPKYDGSEYGTAADSGSGLGNFMAGMGKGFVDIGRAIGQPLGMVSQADIEASRMRDAPLMDTGAGLTGNILGTAAALAPIAMIPGANTLAGAAAIGAGSGMALTPGTLGERAAAGGMGALGGAGGLLAGRALSAGAQGAKAIVEPFTTGGRENIAARTMQRFAGNADEAAKAAAGATELVPGSMPTLAEATGDPGLAQLQRAIGSTDPQTTAALAARESANRAARISAINGIAGDDATMAAAKAQRKNVASYLYKQAMDAGINVDEKSLGSLANILNKDSADQAWQRALQIARENGEDLGGAIEITPKHLQYLKQGYDDLLDTSGPMSSIGKNERAAVMKTRDKLVNWLQETVPAYRAADRAYALNSGPIDRMKAGQYLKDKLIPALGDFGAERESPQALALALRNDLKSGKIATGFGERGLSDVLLPSQMKTVENIARDLARKANAQNSGKAIGSNTAQNLASQNLLRRTLGPMGMPDSWMEETILPALMGPARLAQFAYNAMPEQKIQQLLADAVLDPKLAAKLLKTAIKDKPGTVSRGLLAASPVLGQSAAYGLLK